MGLQFKDEIGRAERDNAIDVYIGDECMPRNETAAQLLHLSGDRSAIRAAAADEMLRMLLDYLN